MGGPTSKKFSYTSRASRGSSWNRQIEPRAEILGGPHLGNAAALSVSLTQLVAAHARAAVLADLADADLGVHEPVSLQQQQLCFPRLWRAARRGHAVGRAVSGSARPVDVVSRRNVVAQSGASLRHPAAALRVGLVAAVDEHDPGLARHAAG